MLTLALGGGRHGRAPGVLITSYDGLRLHAELLLPVRWGYVVCDEGHKLRNPDAEVTLSAKRLQSVHRIVMSGAPMQNNLRELWSLLTLCSPAGWWGAGRARAAGRALCGPRLARQGMCSSLRAR